MRMYNCIEIAIKIIKECFIIVSVAMVISASACKTFLLNFKWKPTEKINCVKTLSASKKKGLKSLK